MTPDRRPALRTKVGRLEAEIERLGALVRDVVSKCRQAKPGLDEDDLRRLHKAARTIREEQDRVWNELAVARLRLAEAEAAAIRAGRLTGAPTNARRPRD